MLSLRTPRAPASKSWRRNIGVIRLQSTTSVTPRARLSKIWIPTGGIAAAEREDAHAKLIRGGYLRQSHVGIFHMLPLGQRVQEKLEKLIDKHMVQVGASKVSLSSISSQALWERTKRLEGYGPELLRFNDRKETPLLLAPTHEEEITTLVSKLTSSYKNLPLRLYQIGRKYRDEIRPRHGLLRSREFVMKDLYTFDATVESAMKTYAEVRAAYSQIFEELKLPYLVAEASSGDIGGDLSHEYHLPSTIGEDIVINCDTCNYTANEELAVAKPKQVDAKHQGTEQCWHGITKDRTTLVHVWYRGSTNTRVAGGVNAHAIKAIVPNLDSSVEDPVSLWKTLAAETDFGNLPKLKTVHIFDQSLGLDKASIDSEDARFKSELPGSKVEIITSHDKKPLNLLRIQNGDGCTQCASGKLKIQKAIELGHTFHLGTRYSKPLGAGVQLRENITVPMQMGCHGIGVSRIIGAVADHLADEKGLNWPRAIAPYEVVIVAGRGAEESDANLVYDQLVRQGIPGNSETLQPLDVVLDDRAESFPWKMKDADTVGYPVVVLLGRRWAAERLCEVQCRRLSVKEDVALDELPMYINGLLSRL